MAHKLSVEYPGAIYHVMNRGDRREAIFRDKADRKRGQFLVLSTRVPCGASTGVLWAVFCLFSGPNGVLAS